MSQAKLDLESVQIVDIKQLNKHMQLQPLVMH